MDVSFYGVNTNGFHSQMKRLRHNDTVFISCCFFALTLSLLVFFWNFLHQDYYLDFQWMGGKVGFYFLLFQIFLYMYLAYAQTRYVMISAVLKSIAMLVITLSVIELGNTAILTTPFSTHDHLMVSWDRLLGFHMLPILEIVHANPSIQHVIWTCYFSLLLVIHCLPISLAIIEKSRVSYHYFCSFVISVIIGYVIYYFFPTMTSPAAVYPHQYFTSFQLNTLHQFQLEHLHKIIRFGLVGGVVSFPSFHAIWATLVVYFLWPYGGIKYVGLIYGIVVMCVAVITGWHYLVDIIAGVGISMVSIWIGDHLLTPDQTES